VEQTTLTRQVILAELFRSPHGKLEDYGSIGQAAAVHDPYFLAHAIAWDKRHGTIRDVQVGVPVVSLATPAFPGELRQNSLAHLALLSPRDLLRAWTFTERLPFPAHRHKRLERMIHDYLRAREACPPWWERTALAFRPSLKALYAVTHTKANELAKRVLFTRDYPDGSIFALIRSLRHLSAEEVAGHLRVQHIPFLTALRALGGRVKEPTILAALVDTMTPGQLMHNRKTLEAWGVQTTAASRGATQAAMTRAQRGMRRDTVLATTKAATAIAEEDPSLAIELEAVQEAQLDAQARIEGNWLILGDRSSSMQHAVATTQLLAAYMARMVKGRVLLVFFNHEPESYDVTGKTYAQIQAMTQHIQAEGGTAIGCGVALALERQFAADAIAIVSDGGERHAPGFPDAYARYSAWLTKQPPVYLYRVPGQDPDWLSGPCQAAGMPYQVFPVAPGIDAYALGALAATMRVQRYGLLDEIMQTPLLTLFRAFQPPKQWRHYAPLPTPAG
jgi:hypothetical protein